MIYYMHSKTFFEEYLNNESDRDILNAQYVSVSTHIRRRDTTVENVICVNTILYPNSSVLSRGTLEDMRDAYHEQLKEDALIFIAELIRGSIEENLNIIFICSKPEWKLKYLKWLSEFILMEFDYPIYNYHKYIAGCPLLEYDKNKVLSHVKEITSHAQKKLYEQNRKTKQGRKQIMHDYKEMSKKELKRICIEQDLYYDGMSKHEMLDMLDAFL